MTLQTDNKAHSLRCSLMLKLYITRASTSTIAECDINKRRSGDNGGCGKFDQQSSDDRRLSITLGTQHPALCTARWSIGREAVSRGSSGVS